MLVVHKAAWATLRACRLVRKTPAALLLLFLFGCNKEAEQQRLAIDGVSNLRERFNRGACLEIQSQTTEPNNAALKERWLKGCEQMRETLGVWRNSNLITADAISKNTKPLTIFVQGQAVFQNGDHTETYGFTSGWLIQDSRAKLTYIWFEGGGKQFGLPVLPPPHPILHLEDSTRRPS